MSEVPHTLNGHRDVRSTILRIWAQKKTESESPLILQSEIGQHETSKWENLEKYTVRSVHRWSGQGLQETSIHRISVSCIFRVQSI